VSDSSAPTPTYGYAASTASAGEATFHVNDLWRVIKNRWPTSVTILILVMATGFVVTKLQPKIYESSAVLRVEKENRDLQVFQAAYEAFDPVFFQTEFELIQSKKVLNSVFLTLSIPLLCGSFSLMSFVHGRSFFDYYCNYGFLINSLIF
jgi:uncharacterized protein involved in exopolysaccharide biosynthesis